MRVSMIVLVFFRVRTRRLRRIFPPFPTRFLPRQYIRRLSGRRRSHRSESMLLLLATHVDLELSFGSSSNQPLSYCSEKRSLHLQLEKRTLLFSLDRSASCDCWRSQGSTGAQPQRPASARGRRRGFLSDRKYRYHPRTQADVADCWPCPPPPPPPGSATDLDSCQHRLHRLAEVVRFSAIPDPDNKNHERERETVLLLQISS